MPEPSLAVFVAHSTRILPDFPHNKRSKNERLPLLHFAFFPLHFAFNQQVKKQRIQNQNIINQKSNATPYGRPSTTKNALNEDGARGRTAVTEWNEFAVLAFFWFLFWGNAKKGTKTRSNKQKIKTSSTKRSKATPYGRPSNTKNALNEDGAGGRTAVTEYSPAWSSGPKAQPEFAVLALFWFLFWGNAKKGTKTRSNDQKPRVNP
ncbi:MAG: hypothetical protein H6562_14440 [Lewinellaceae bacterium]|nr:hypothetical protein [Lewinellaceae bacterium]